MRTRHTAVLTVATLFALLGVTALYSEVRSGTWTMTRSDEPGKVEFSLIQSNHGGRSQFGATWPLSAFEGLDATQAARHDVRFTITRDAGKIACDGFLEKGEGAGLFHFQPDGQYPQKMSGLGFGGIDEDKQFAMAAQDVSLKFAREMKNEHLEGLDTDKLLAFRIFGVSSQFIEEIRAAGINVSDSDKLVAFRIHGVTPEMIRTLRQQGYTPDADKLIALRIHGATPEWIAQIGKLGYNHLDLDQYVAFRIHGVSPEFINKLAGLGYKHPEPDQLIAMRIHGVTPEFIAGVKSQHGLENLTIDQLVNLRIHGID